MNIFLITCRKQNTYQSEMKKIIKYFLTFLQLIEYGENFVAKKKKLIYTEIWSLALAPDGTNLICARDNDCNIYDLGMNFVSTILQLLSL